MVIAVVVVLVIMFFLLFVSTLLKYVNRDGVAFFGTDLVLDGLDVREHQLFDAQNAAKRNRKHRTSGYEMQLRFVPPGMQFGVLEGHVRTHKNGAHTGHALERFPNEGVDGDFIIVHDKIPSI